MMGIRAARALLRRRACCHSPLHVPGRSGKITLGSTPFDPSCSSSCGLINLERPHIRMLSISSAEACVTRVSEPMEGFFSSVQESAHPGMMGPYLADSSGSPQREIIGGQLLTEHNVKEDDERTLSSGVIVEMSKLVDSETLTRLNSNEIQNLNFLHNCGVTMEQLAHLLTSHSSLLCMNLGGALSSARDCMGSFNLKASILGQALYLEPDLVKLFSERALEERVQLLQDVGFSVDDVAAFLKTLYRKQWGLFLRLGIEQIEMTIAFLVDLGIKKVEAVRLMRMCPTMLLRDIAEDYECKMKVLSNVLEDWRKAKKVFVHLPDLFARRTDAFEETVLYVKVMTGDDDVKKLIEDRPIVLTHSKSALQRVCEYFQKIGFTSKRAVALVAMEPYLVSCEVERFERQIKFLKGKGMDEAGICALIESSPQMFCKAVERKLSSKIKFFENQGITGETLQRYFKSRPQVFSKSVRDSMVPNLKFLLGLGFEENTASLRSALKVTLPHKCKSMQARIDYLVSIGIELDDVQKIVREIPAILTMTDSGIKARIEFLQKSMKRSLQELVECPFFLVSNIDSTIKPRAKVLDMLRSEGIKKRLPLSVVVETTEEAFLKRFVEPYPQILSTCKGLFQQHKP